MKAYTRTPGSTDGAGARHQGVTGWVTRYRAMTRTIPGSPDHAKHALISLRPEDRRLALSEFMKGYESLVEVLCDAAQFGISAEFEKRYQNSRLDLINRYAGLRIFLGAYLRPSPEDTKGLSQGIRFDAFDALLAPATLELFLQCDDGYTISRVTRTREALNLYAEHLKQLVERTR